MGMTALIVGVLVGSGLGAVLGATRSCKDGGCPLTANPRRGALWGGFLGLMVAAALAGPDRRAAGQPVSVEPPAQTAAAAPEAPRAVTAVRSMEQLDAMLARPGRSALFLHAEWCAPCRLYGPTFEKVAADSAGKVGFFEADVDRSGKVAERLHVEAIPTTVVFENGHEVERLVGAVGEKRLRQAVGL